MVLQIRYETVESKQLGFADYLAAVVDSRNQLVHHFFPIPGVSLVEEGPMVAVKWLKHQHAFCVPLKTMGEELFAALLSAKERRAAENGEELVVDAWRDHWQLSVIEMTDKRRKWRI